MIELCRKHSIPLRLDDFTLMDVYGAEEAFVTATFGGVTPVRSVDGRGHMTVPGPITARLQRRYRELIDNSIASDPVP